MYLKFAFDKRQFQWIIISVPVKSHGHDWRFPFRHGGIPRNHPFIDGFFDFPADKLSICLLWKPPCDSVLASITHPKRSAQGLIEAVEADSAKDGLIVQTASDGRERFTQQV
jgi:hypothetical protein